MNKAYILQEIRRTAEANGGVPLGVRKLELEAGIKESDWGKYWARLSEAHRELGYAPNQLNVSYDKDKLLDKYAKLAQELGRLPTDRDLRLKDHRDSSFPSTKPFRRLGTKAELVKQLAEYCRTHDGYEDVVGFCEDYTLPKNIPALVDDSMPGEVTIAFVYLIKSGRFYKIGRSNAAGRREYELAIQLPEKASKVHAIRTDDPSGIEAYWHNRFAAKRKNGEWFQLDGADIAAFKRRKFM